MRQAYVFHAVNFVCHDRQRVFENDMKLLEDKNKDRVTLQNVFEIAEGQNEQADEDKASQHSDSENEDDDDEEIEEE